MLQDTTQIIIDPTHFHTSDCWKETGWSACFIYRIHELERELESVDATLNNICGHLRQVKSQIDRTEKTISNRKKMKYNKNREAG